MRRWEKGGEQLLLSCVSSISLFDFGDLSHTVMPHVCTPLHKSENPWMGRKAIDKSVHQEEFQGFIVSCTMGGGVPKRSPGDGGCGLTQTSSTFCIQTACFSAIPAILV